MRTKRAVLRFIKMATRRPSIKKKNPPALGPNKFVEIKKGPSPTLALMKKVPWKRFPRGRSQVPFRFDSQSCRRSLLVFLPVCLLWKYENLHTAPLKTFYYISSSLFLFYFIFRRRQAGLKFNKPFGSRGIFRATFLYAVSDMHQLNCFRENAIYPKADWINLSYT